MTLPACMLTGFLRKLVEANVLGQWLHKSGKRHDIILVSKGGHPDMTPAVPDMHASRISAENMRHDLNFLFVPLALIILIFIFITEIMKQFLPGN